MSDNGDTIGSSHCLTCGQEYMEAWVCACPPVGKFTSVEVGSNDLYATYVLSTGEEVQMRGRVTEEGLTRECDER